MMTRTNLTELGITVKEDGRIDFSKPPKGKRFMAIPVEKEDLELMDVDRRFVVMHKFSATKKLAVMELIDENDAAAVDEFITNIKTECKQEERKSRCKICSPKTGRVIYCPESIKCNSEDCPRRLGVQAEAEWQVDFDEMEEKIKESVYMTDPTADAAMTNLMWSSFQEKLRKEEPQLADILSWNAYGYTRDEILLKLKRKVTDKSWYYYQWSRIRKLWEEYNRD